MCIVPCAVCPVVGCFTITITITITHPPQVLAYDIECTKAPLKFPNVEIDQVRSNRMDQASGGCWTQLRWDRIGERWFLDAAALAWY